MHINFIATLKINLCTSAQYNLGMLLYASGKKEDGKKWLRSASYLGSEEAKNSLNSILNTESNK